MKMAGSHVVALLFCLFVSSFSEEQVRSGGLESELDDDIIVYAGDLHNLYDCPDPKKAVNVLYDEPLSVEGHWFQIQSKTIQFPDSIINDRKITCINVRDLDANGAGGYPVVVDGGVGNYHVTVHFYTQRGKGMHFRVQIYSE